ncbi:cytochrome P450 [Kribbella sp. NPDC051620]|uniref:cytochrome P450 n=1 Tax=Kribbella sp. NPDC051620 TaxID=3364120 RepID=UPI0037A5EA36
MTPDRTQLTWASAEFAADPVAMAEPHRPDQVVFDPEQEGWIVLRHDDIDTVLRSDDYRKDPRTASACPYTTKQRAMAGSSLIFMDDPDRKRLRRLITRSFAHRNIIRMRPRIQEIATQLLSRIDPSGPFDLVSAYSVPLSVRVIASLIGVETTADQERFVAWSEDLELEYGHDLAPADLLRIRASRAELAFYFLDAIEQRRAEPRDDLISTLVAAHDRDGALTEEELVSTLVTLLVAGNVSTADLVSNAAVALLRHPEQLAMVRADPGLLPAAIEEVLRWDSPLTIVDRITARPLTLGDVRIPAGSWIWPAIASANHDPAAHRDPGEFDIGRTGNHHLSFGAGARLCLGAELARAEAEIAIATLFGRFPDLQLDPDIPPDRHSKPSFHGFSRISCTA